MGMTVVDFSSSVLVAAEVSALVATLLSSWVSHIGSTRICTLCCVIGGLSNIGVIFLPAKIDSTNLLIVLCILRLIYGVTFNLLNSSVQSSVVHNVEESKIGKITGIVESSWTMGAVSFVAVGEILSVYGWKGPFVVNGVLMLFMTPFVFKYMPRDSDLEVVKDEKALVLEKDGDDSKAGIVSLLCSWKVFSLLGCLLLRDGGMYLILSSYSLWLEEDWRHTADEAGLASLVISGGEAIAFICMSLFSDRIGLERNMLGVTLLIVLTSLGIGTFEGTNLPTSLAFLGLGFVCFEWGAILTIAITGSSAESGSRIFLLAVMFMTMAVARSLSAVLVETLWEMGGMKVIAFIASGMQLAAVCLLATRGIDNIESASKEKSKWNWVERQL